jgi:hypothetical protein
MMKRNLSVRCRARACCVVPALAAGLVLVLAASAAANVARPLGGMFSITPARHYVVARPPVQLSATRVANTTQDTLQVRVFSVLLSQLPSGAFTFEPSSQSLANAASVLGVSSSDFTLRPGESRYVSLLWHELPPHARIANLGVVYQATPQVADTPVRIVERLMGLDVLRLPGHYHLAGQLTGVHVAQLEPGTLGFALDMRNTGQAVAGPSRMELSIRNDHGIVMLQRTLPGDIVLPHATREFVLELKHQLPAGLYTVRAHAAFGASHRLEAASTFELGAPNQLTSSRLQLGPMAAQGTIAHSAQVSATLKNTGTATGHLAINLGLYRLMDGTPAGIAISRRHILSSSLAPGHSARLNYHLGRLRAGTYRLIASYQESDGARQTLVADFQAERKPTPYARLRSFCVQHAIMLPLLLLLVSVSIITLILRRCRQLKRALTTAERQLAQRHDPLSDTGAPAGSHDGDASAGLTHPVAISEAGAVGR